jgi:single-stranded DNA-binding protein
MKTIIIDGRIGKDGAKVLKTKNGKAYIRFSLANDSFVNGANKTEWFDITSFDDFVVEKQSKMLTQGRYVIVNGVLNSEVATNNGKVYLNQYVRCNNIEIPSLGSKKDDSNETQVSTYTGGTKSEETARPEARQESKPAETPQPQPSVVASSMGSGWSNDDDLPF